MSEELQESKRKHLPGVEPGAPYEYGVLPKQKLQTHEVLA